MIYKIIDKTFIEFKNDEVYCIFHLHNIDGINIYKDSIELIIKGYAYTIPIELDQTQIGEIIQKWMSVK